MKVPIEISRRHIHLDQNDLEKLFGKDHRLKNIKKLTQPQDFAAEETLTIINGENKIKNVRIVGPIRKDTQVEISSTDAYNLKIDNVPIKCSGDVINTPGITLGSKTNKITINFGVIIPQRHLHLSPSEAEKNGVKNNQIVSIKTNGERSVIFNNVIVRSRADKDSLSFQIDSDEANAAGIKDESTGELII